MCQIQSTLEHALKPSTGPGRCSVVVIMLAGRYALIPTCQLVLNDILHCLINVLAIKTPAHPRYTMHQALYPSGFLQPLQTPLRQPLRNFAQREQEALWPGKPNCEALQTAANSNTPDARSKHLG